MNDDFIYRALPEVRKEFAGSLYAKISAATPASFQRGIYRRFRGLRRSHAVLIVLGVLLLVAWSQLRLLIRYVPVGDLWLVEFSRSTQLAPGDQPAIPFVPSPLPTLPFFDGTVMPMPDRTFQIFFPTWIPGGFEAIEPPYEMTAYEATIWMWSNDAGEKIRLFFVGRAGGMRPYAPQGMWKEVSVNGQPAILIHGRYAPTSSENPRAQRKWDETLGLQLHWIMGKHVYTLETYGPYVSEQDLIRMAESVEEMPAWITPTP
ncbi:MAG TPA: DUF4367 domain-containing protein [Anaerolineales bacterium]|nr:DUF4367 domain-containing protein [Anaerolineales bacterium]